MAFSNKLRNPDVAFGAVMIRTEEEGGRNGAMVLVVEVVVVVVLEVPQGTSSG